MKRVRTFLIRITLVVILSGCTGTNIQTHEDNESVVDSLTFGEKFYVNAWELTVTQSEKLAKIGEVEQANQVTKGRSIYEIEGYPDHDVIAVEDDGSGAGLYTNVTGFSVYVWNEDSSKPNHYPLIPDSKIQQIQIYTGTELSNDLIGEEVQVFLELMKQQGPDNEFQFDRTPQYTVLYITDEALGYNYGIMETNGEFGLPHIESKLPAAIAKYFKSEEALKTELMSVREAAWNSISEQDQLYVIGDWSNAQVSKINFEDMINQFSIPKGGYPKTSIENLYRVTFESKQDILGPLVIFVDGDQLKVVGTMNRD